MIYEQLQCIGGFIILTGYIKQIRDIYDWSFLFRIES